MWSAILGWAENLLGGLFGGHHHDDDEMARAIAQMQASFAKQMQNMTMLIVAGIFGIALVEMLK